MKLPSSPHKRYLGGADWCLAALNRGTLETTGRRSIFHLAVFLEGVPDASRAEAGFKEFCARFPVLWGRLARCWCLAPYWKYSKSANNAEVFVSRRSLPAQASRQDVVRQIESLTNAQEFLQGCAVAMHIMEAGESGSVLVFSFDHHLFDAVGAETFVDLFFRFLDGDAPSRDFPESDPTAPAQLDQWGRRFASGRKVNRLMRRLGDGPTAWLPLPDRAPGRPFRFRIASFDEEESRRIKERAFAVAGYLMFMPYVLATAASVFGPFFRRRAEPAAHVVVSVSTDKPKAAAAHVPHFFFNDLSFLYYRFPISDMADRNALAGALREQLIDQVKEEMPAAIEDSNLLMRILPARMFWKFLMRFYRNRLASFAFTCLGAPALKASAVLGCPVRSHIHFPVIPTPPGIGIVLNQSRGVYHAVLSYIEGILSEEEIDVLWQSFRATLLDDPPRADRSGRAS
jgi:hypothetical protein